MIVTTEMLEEYVIFPEFLREFKTSMTAKLIYSVIMTEAMKGKMTDEQGRLYMEISTEKLAGQIGKSKPSVKTHLRTLSDVGLIQSENLCWQAKLLALNLLALDSGDYETAVLAQRTGLTEGEVDAAAEQLVKAGYMDRTAYGFYFKEAAV